MEEQHKREWEIKKLGNWKKEVFKKRWKKSEKKEKNIFRNEDKARTWKQINIFNALKETEYVKNFLNFKKK